MSREVRRAPTARASSAGIEPRAAHIPLVLWISAALVAHFVGGSGAVEVAKIVIDRNDLRDLSRGVRRSMLPSDTTFELLTDNATPTPMQKVAPTNAPETAEKPDPDDKKDDEKEPVDKAKPPPPKPVEKEAAKKLPEPPKVEEKKDTPLPVPVPVNPAVPIVPDHRIAIKQNAKPKQADNPNAARIADEANHTDEETVAKLRNHVTDDAKPTPGQSKGGPKEDVGNGDKTDVADNEDHKGNKDKAPGEGKTASTTVEHNNPPPPVQLPSKDRGVTPTMPGAKGVGGGKPAQAGLPPAPPASRGGAGPASPEVVNGDHGGYTIDPANPGGNGEGKSPGRKRPTPPYTPPVRIGSLGLNGAGVPGGPNINLDMPGLETAVGLDKLKAERAADGAARRSAHRGSWEGNKFERWRAAIENYEPSVKPGNQTSLNAARVPFATYINAIHNRIHPIFGDEFLSAVNDLPKGHALNNAELVTKVEIVLSKDQGRVVRIGITKSSGVTAFDVVALSSVNRASPFGKAPDMIVSPDGNVYLHWEFHRDPYDACTTRNAYPYLLKTAPVLKQPAGVKKKTVPGAPQTDDRSPPGPLVPLRRP